MSNHTNQPIPNHLKDTHYKGATTINQNATYDYPLTTLTQYQNKPIGMIRNILFSKTYWI